MFTERKIEKFQQTISGLPDTPNLSAAELKRRFDACPEELRKALNGVCDDGAALEKRMDAYRAETFEGEITRDMLAPAVRDELSGKAEQTALAAETAARENLAETVAQKCEILLGTYTGNGAESQMIPLGFTPKAVLVLHGGTRVADTNFGYGGLAFADTPAAYSSYVCVTVVKNGFTVRYHHNTYVHANMNGEKYTYLAFK